jgi:hypothetical protein
MAYYQKMSGSRIIESMKEAVAISRGELSKGIYRVYIPEWCLRYWLDNYFSHP